MRDEELEDAFSTVHPRSSTAAAAAAADKKNEMTKLGKANSAAEQPADGSAAGTDFIAATTTTPNE